MEPARPSDPLDHLRLLALALLDIRVTVEAMLRDVAHAESCVEVFQRDADRESLEHVAVYLSRLGRDGNVVAESAGNAAEPLTRLLHPPRSVT